MRLIITDNRVGTTHNGGGGGGGGQLTIKETPLGEKEELADDELIDGSRQRKNSGAGPTRMAASVRLEKARRRHKHRCLRGSGCQANHREG